MNGWMQTWLDVFWTLRGLLSSQSQLAYLARMFLIISGMNEKVVKYTVTGRVSLLIHLPEFRQSDFSEPSRKLPHFFRSRISRFRFCISSTMFCGEDFGTTVFAEKISGPQYVTTILGPQYVSTLMIFFEHFLGKTGAL